MEQYTSFEDRPSPRPQITPSLRDGLITISGLTVAMGSFFHREIMLWWLGA